ncbi:MAG: phenylalanine--tRNA ligase subunit beta [Chitinophagales bacterium]|nr:phenylalanine--tRNA ligase subunit beta [Chitinophagales bacterium]
MKISYNWLCDYVQALPPVEEVSVILTSLGLEVEDIIAYESIKGGLQGVVVGEVLTCVPHPQADKLKLTTVNIGTDTPLNIVCGAPNVAVGQKVPTALVGTTLYPSVGEPITLKKAKIRGEESMGMLCAEDELGLGASHAGILVLDPATPVGTPVAALLDVYVDHVFEIGLTPNRSDAYSHYGVAREIVAYLSVHHPERKAQLLPLLKEEEIQSTIESPIQVQVLDNEACARYCGRYFANAKVESAPKWMSNRLQAIGIRSINNIVDITNYVLHDCGQPLHAFDADKIAQNTLLIHTSNNSYTLKTLDANEAKIEKGDLLIADPTQALCLAGIMGGDSSAVSDTTKNIFLESAWFKPSTIRKTATRLGLRTDSALHFEKRVDQEMAPIAITKASVLLKQFANIEACSAISNTHPEPFAKTVIRIRLDQINDRSGLTLNTIQVELLLGSLGFVLESIENGVWNLRVPSHKTDIHEAADIIEEVVRLYGLDKIPMASSVQAIIPIQAPDRRLSLREKVAETLVANGVMEMINNSLTRSAYYGEVSDAVKLLNSINTELDMLRQNLLFGGLEVIAHNNNRQQGNQGWFEFGKVYFKKEEGVYAEHEQWQLIGAGEWKESNWQGKAQAFDFFALKNIVQQVAAACGIRKVAWENADVKNMQLGFVWKEKDVRIAEAGIVDAETLKKFGIKTNVWAATIHWDALYKFAAKQNIKYAEVSKFPSVQRDLALVLDKHISYADIERIAIKQCGAVLKKVDLFDVYIDVKLGENKKSYAINLLFQDESKTLTDDKMESIMKRLTDALQNELHANVRS